MCPSSDRTRRRISVSLVPPASGPLCHFTHTYSVVGQARRLSYAGVEGKRLGWKVRPAELFDVPLQRSHET